MEGNRNVDSGLAHAGQTHWHQVIKITKRQNLRSAATVLLGLGSDLFLETGVGGQVESAKLPYTV